MTTRTEIIDVTAGDGRRINLEHVTSEADVTKGPVLVVHGAGVRANIFRAPVRQTIVDVLLADGYDVWLENWRASIDLEPCQWSLDDAAVFDHPVAVREVMRRTGASSIKALVHCQGSTSFVMSAAAGLLPDVETIVSNAVSFHPIIPPFSRFKIHTMAPLVAKLTPYMNPAWGKVSRDGSSRPPTPIARAIVAAVKATHHECDNTVCKLVSFTYGAGFPALWSHENLNPATHEWLKDEFAEVPFTFFSQMARCVRLGTLEPVKRYDGLPPDLLDKTPRTDARFALLAGEDNLCFLPESQERSAEWLSRNTSGDHSLHVFARYGHLDVFMGKHAAEDIFPTILKELEHS